MTDKGHNNEFGEQGAQVVSFAAWDRAVRRAQARDRAFDLVAQLDKTTTQPDKIAQVSELEDKIAQVSELEAYYALKKRGLDEALPVLGALRADQIRTLFDLELWRTDRIAVADVLLWLEGFRVAGREALVRAAEALDPEALAAVLRRRLHIALIPKEDRSDNDFLPSWVQYPPQGIEPIMRTPDERFFIAARTEDQWFELEGEGDPVIDEDERKQVLALVRELYLSENWGFIAGVLRIAQADMLSDLEESAYKFRNHRLEDLGFPPLDRALRVYLPMDPTELMNTDTNYQPVSLNSREACLPILHHQVLSSGLFGEALRELETGVAERVEADLIFVANSVLVSDRIDPADMESIRDALHRMKGYLSIALELHGGSEDPLIVARTRLETVHISVLHRIGYTCTLKLKERAKAIYQHEGTADLGHAAFGLYDQHLLEGLMAPRPRCYTKDVDYKPFTSLGDIQAMEAHLDELGALVRVSAKYGWLTRSWGDVLPQDPSERDLNIQLLTSTLQYMLVGKVEVQPLREPHLLELLDRLGSSEVQGQYSDTLAVARVVSERLESNPTPLLQSRIEQLLNDFASTMFPLVGRERVDLRFIEGVLRQRIG
ncbi:MAG: hypothetical protein KTR25_05350 [Myxococcales bacterium]|nr:hypothetical protein [Myxococcales bacterium]